MHTGVLAYSTSTRVRVCVCVCVRVCVITSEFDMLVFRLLLRGFETVTYVTSGCLRHEDFCGHEGILSAGDVQWMTAGRGIVHSEMPHTRPAGSVEKNGGFQLWINLKSADKMCEPEYQELESADIPTASASGVHVKVVAGSSLGVASALKTRTPALFLDITLDPRGSCTQALTPGWNGVLYVFEGRIAVEDSVVEKHHAAVLDADGDHVTIINPDKTARARCLLIAGKPIGEPVVQYGPFVMNTMEEIEKTFQDLRQGKNGFERAPRWKSKAGIH